MLGCALLLLVVYPWPSAEAIPAFARKYQTSCQTCHIAYPKLNPFGTAFRLRGYHLPDETEDLIKEQPVSLGAPSYKKLWPQTVWPSDIPGTVPLSLGTIFTYNTERTTDEEGVSETIKNDLHFPEEVAILSGGTLGESLSFFGEIVFASEGGEVGVELEHAQVNFNGPFGSGNAFNVKVGRFMPEMAQAFGHGAGLTDGPEVFFGYVPIAAHGGYEVGGDEAGAGIAIPHTVDGLEAYGILGHRFLYSAGFANGISGVETADGNAQKDVYGRAAFKIGGLPYDGEGYVAGDKNWSELSLQLGAFVYQGFGRNIFFSGDEADTTLEDRNFTRVGVDTNVYLKDLNMIAGYVHGRDEIAEYVDSVPDVNTYTYNTWFLEGDYVLLPWLHPGVLYEWLEPADSEAPNFKRVVPKLTALIRANVKTSLEYQRNTGENDDYAVIGTLRVLF